MLFWSSFPPSHPSQAPDCPRVEEGWPRKEEGGQGVRILCPAGASQSLPVLSPPDHPLLPLPRPSVRGGKFSGNLHTLVGGGKLSPEEVPSQCSFSASGDHHWSLHTPIKCPGSNSFTFRKTKENGCEKPPAKVKRFFS